MYYHYNKLYYILEHYMCDHSKSPSPPRPYSLLPFLDLLVPPSPSPASRASLALLLSKSSTALCSATALVDAGDNDRDNGCNDRDDNRDGDDGDCDGDCEGGCDGDRGECDCDKGGCKNGDDAGEDDGDDGEKRPRSSGGYVRLSRSTISSTLACVD